MIGFCVQLLIRIDEIVQSSKEANKISSNNVFKVFKVCSRFSFCCVVCTRMKDRAESQIYCMCMCTAVNV